MDVKFISYEVEQTDTLSSGIITIDVALTAESWFQGILLNPSIAFAFNDPENPAEETYTRHFLVDRDMYVPEDIENPVTEVNPPLQAGFLSFDSVRDEPLYQTIFSGGSTPPRRFRIKVFPVRNNPAIPWIDIANYPVDTWDILVIAQSPVQEAPGFPPPICTSIPVDINNQIITGPFSENNASSMVCTVVSRGYMPGAPVYIPFECIEEGKLYYCDPYVLGTNQWRGFATDKSEALNPAFIQIPGSPPQTAPGLQSDQIQNLDDNQDSILTPGVHHAIIEVKVNYTSGSLGEITYYLYDDIEIEVAPIEAGKDGYYDSYYIAKDSLGRPGIGHSRIIVTSAGSPAVNDYATELDQDFIDLRSLLFAPTITKVETLSISKNGEYVAVGVVQSGERKLYVLRFTDGSGEFPEHIGPIEVLDNWFRLDGGDIFDECSLTDLFPLHVQEMKPALSPDGKFLIFEATVARPESLGICPARFYKRVYATKLDWPFYSWNQEITKVTELVWPYVDSSLDSANEIRDYNSSEPSIGGTRGFTFNASVFENLGPGSYPCYLVSYTSTLSLEGSLFSPAFKPGESHLSFTFIYDTASGIKTAYGMYFDEGNYNTSASQLDPDHPGASCSSSFVNEDATLIAYIGTDGSYSLPYYNRINDSFVYDAEDPINSTIFGEGTSLFIWVCRHDGSVACQLPRDSRFYWQNYWRPKLSQKLADGIKFRGVLRQGLDIDSDIIAFEVFDATPCPPINVSNFCGDDNILCINQICGFGTGYEDLPYMSGDGSAAVFTGHDFNEGDVFFVYIPPDKFPPDEINPIEYPGAKAGAKCIRITETGGNTYPVVSSFNSN